MSARLCTAMASTLFATFCAACNAAAPSLSADARLANPAPWLVIHPDSGYDMARYGWHDDADGRMTIAATWADARPFANGFAVVGQRQGKHGAAAQEIRYGVINERGQAVVQPDYDSIELVTRGPLTLAFLRKQYNAPWRFWQWHAPNLLSTSTPITRVLRDDWRVITLPNQKKLLGARMGYQDSLGQGYHRRYHNDNPGAEAHTVIPFALHLGTASDLFSIGDDVFLQAGDGSVRKISDGFIRFTQDGSALVQTKRDGPYALVTPDGHRNPGELTAANASFHDAQGVPVTAELTSGTSGATFWRKQFPSDEGDQANVWTEDLLLTRDFRPRFPFIQQEPIYRDANGHLYLAPDFKTPLPTTVADYVQGQDHFTAAQIIRHTRLLAALPHNAGFLLTMDTQFTQPGRTFILKPDGSWDVRAPAFLRAPTRMFSDGRIVFVGKGSRGVLGADFHFWPTPLSTTSPVANQPAWYLGQDADTRKYGVYDAAHQRWQVPPRYNWLAGELVPGIAVYRNDTTEHRNGVDFPTRRFGLLDIAANQAVTPPLYDFVDTDGRVGQLRHIVNDYGVKLDPGFAFYLDPHTGAPFLSMDAASAPGNKTVPSSP